MGDDRDPDDDTATSADPSASPAVGDTPTADRESLKERFSDFHEQLAAKYAEYEGRREESLPIDVAFRVVEADRRYAGGLIAGGMAFRVFILLVPFAFVVVTAFGFVSEIVDSESPEQVARDLGITGLVASAIDASIGSSTWERIVTLVFATYALLWATWALMRAMQTVFGLAWHQDHPTTSIAKSWRPLLWMVVIMVVLFLAGAAVSVVLDQVGLLAGLVIRVLTVGLVAALWTAVSWLLPRDPETTWTALLPGSVVVAVGAVLLQFLTVAFFSRYIEDKTSTYGAIGASLAFLLWAYLLGRLVVTSAFLNAERWRRARETVPTSRR